MKPEKILDDWPESAQEALIVVERYYHLSRKFAHQYAFSLQLFQMPVSEAEVLSVVQAEDRLAAADELITRKINRW
ncbi:hypothetical protein [Rhodoferax saidenbachensis]|uniref:Uncharacterized protein n=1 Tax=Rhodoferax saidenbachensis TaxID=1484693 RepID=A0ABU1ZQX2_9BURK|nr:hypothetical protein [Rhodoferax saidenbachensis]MDR7307955.1 hypothetical protein [Rhodoferax saidenbachensis]